MKRKLLILLIFIALIIACSSEKKNHLKIDNNSFVSDTTWKSLSLREKIGQTMIIWSKIYEQEDIGNGSLDTFFHRYPVSGFFMADWYFPYFTTKDSIVFYLKKSISQYDAASKTPLIFMEDYERGLGEKFSDYTHMPVEMALGAGRSEELAYNYGKSIAIEAKNLGINWLLHPVADLSINPLHPLVGERAIADDAEIALPLLKKQLTGIQDQKVVATIKHFPGDGTSMRDQHLVTPSNKLEYKQWEQTYGNLYRNLINEGARAVMAGHISFPAFQNTKLNGEFPPATISPELINLLKKDLDFNGVVISDALNMGGIAGFFENELEATVACFEAGVDLILWPQLAYMDTLEARILRKEIPIERLDDAVSRIWAVKKQFGIHDKNKNLFTEMNEKDRIFIDSTARLVAENAITLIRGLYILPITPEKDKNILLISISQKDKTGVFSLMKSLLEERGFDVTLQFGLSYFEWGWRAGELDKYDRIIACLENKYFDPVGTPYFKAVEAESVWMINTLPKEKIISVSFSNPFFNNFYFGRIPVCINAYSSDKYMQEVVVKALTGELSFKGKSPVNLDQESLK